MNVSSELPIDLIEIDSFKLRILLKKVEVLEVSLRGKWIPVHEITGEVDTTQFKENSFLVKENGIKTRYSIGKLSIKPGSPSEEYLVININAKLLKERYFEGITKDNIEVVYNELIKQKIVNFSFKDFLSSEITDVDFKRDVITKGFDDIVPALFNIAKASKKKDEGARVFKQENNLGIEFSDRETTSCKTNPFLKLYHKGIQLKKGSDKDVKDFYTKYLFTSVDDSLIDDRVRTEFTVKNKKHFGYYDVLNTTLKNVLNLSQDVKLNMLRDVVNKHLLDKQVRERVYKDNLPPNDTMCLNAIDALLQSGMAFCQVVEILLRGMDDRSKRSKKKKYLTKLYESFLRGSDYDIKAENTFSFLKWLRG